MRILIVYDLAHPVKGGIESYILNLSKGLIDKGHEVHWLTSRLPNTKKNEIYDNIHIHRVFIPFSKNYLFPGRQLFSFASLMEGIKLAKQMDIVHVNTLIPGFLGWLIAKYSSKPSLLFCHEFYGKKWSTFGRNIFEKFAYPIFELLSSKGLYDGFACPSKYSKKSLMMYSVKEDKISIIPHGVHLADTEFDYRKSNGLKKTPIFGYLGRLKQQGTGQGKNIKGLLDATKYVIQEIPDAKLLIGGEGFDEILPDIKQLGIEENVVYVGKPVSTRGFLKSCDVVVCPALSDGFCFMLAEASFCNVPVVATNRGSHSERIRQNINGLLTEEDPKDIANGIVKILKNKELAKGLSKGGKKLVEGLTWEKSVDSHLELYKKLIQKNQM